MLNGRGGFWKYLTLDIWRTHFKVLRSKHKTSTTVLKNSLLLSYENEKELPEVPDSWSPYLLSEDNSLAAKFQYKTMAGVADSPCFVYSIWHNVGKGRSSGKVQRSSEGLCVWQQGEAVVLKITRESLLHLLFYFKKIFKGSPLGWKSY